MLIAAHACYDMSVNVPHASRAMCLTDDAIIRNALVRRLKSEFEPKYRVISELGVQHGAARIDVAVVNGILHGFEIKSDKDTLLRLRDQRDFYNHVFDRVTLVAGKTHLLDAIELIPDWWGLELAKMDKNGSVVFLSIRKPRDNFFQDGVSIARLLWRHEALEILEGLGKANGVRSKPREAIYTRLASSLELGLLKERVRHVLQHSRQDWRSDVQLA
jgi:hypothetical protein